MTINEGYADHSGKEPRNQDVILYADRLEAGKGLGRIYEPGVSIGTITQRDIFPKDESGAYVDLDVMPDGTLVIPLDARVCAENGEIIGMGRFKLKSVKAHIERCQACQDQINNGVNAGPVGDDIDKWLEEVGK